MEVWRICKEDRASTTYAGIGAAKHGGRFNHKGSPPIVYASDSLALAAHEFWVHLVDRCLPPNFCQVNATIPDSVSRIKLDVSSLPINWDSWPHPVSTREMGTEWLHSLKSCLLVIPSAVIPDNFNVLINPKHADFNQIKIGERSPFKFDERMA